MQKKQEPFIHLFSTPLGYYLYDVNTNEILKIDEDVYDYLQSGNIKDTQTIKKIDKLKREGYLKCFRVEETEHPATELLPFYLQSKVGQLVLQVT